MLDMTMDDMRLKSSDYTCLAIVTALLFTAGSCNLMTKIHGRESCDSINLRYGSASSEPDHPALIFKNKVHDITMFRSDVFKHGEKSLKRGLENGELGKEDYDRAMHLLDSLEKDSNAVFISTLSMSSDLECERKIAGIAGSLYASLLHNDLKPIFCTLVKKGLFSIRDNNNYYYNKVYTKKYISSISGTPIFHFYTECKEVSIYDKKTFIFYELSYFKY